MKDQIQKLDPRTAGTVSITFAVLVALLALLGFLGRDSYAPIILDKVFGITKYVADQTTKEVESGYTKTFIFAESDTSTVSQTLLFYAKPDQYVTLHLSGVSRPSQQKIQIKLDDNVVVDNTGLHRTLPLTLDTPPLAATAETLTGRDFHSLTILPAENHVQGTMVVDALVLVSNHPSL